MKYEEEEFDDELPDLKKWEEREYQLKSQQNQPEPSMWRLIGLVEGKELPMEKVEAYSEKQAVYKLCFDLERKTKTGKHPLKKGWGKIHASLKLFIATNKKVDFWMVKINNNEEEKVMTKEMKMNEKKNIEEIVAKANKTAKETVAQKATKEQPVISETRKAYEAEMATKDALVSVGAIGEITIHGNSFNVSVVKNEKRPHSFNIVNKDGVKIAMFVWGKALLPNITVMKNDELGIGFMKLSTYQKGEDLAVDQDYAAFAAVIFGSEDNFRKQLKAEQNRLVDEFEKNAQRRQAKEEFWAARNAEAMEAAAQLEQERQAKIAAAAEAWKASKLVDFVSVYEGKEIALVARYLKSVDDKGNEVVKAIFAHRGTQKAFARLSWNTYFGGPMLTVVMKDSIWAYERDEKGQSVVGEDGKPIVKWSKVERKHELHMAKSGAIVKKGAYGKEVAVTEAEKATYTCLCNGLAAALGLPQPGPKAARYPMSDEDFFAGLEDSVATKPLRRI